MSCTTKQCSSSQINVIQGQTLSFTIQLQDKNQCDPYNLIGFTGATAYFPQVNTTDALAVSGSLQSADLGKVGFTLDPTITILLNPGEEQSFEVEVDAANTVITQIDSKLFVYERLF